MSATGQQKYSSIFTVLKQKKESNLLTIYQFHRFQFEKINGLFSTIWNIFTSIEEWEEEEEEEEEEGCNAPGDIFYLKLTSTFHMTVHFPEEKAAAAAADGTLKILQKKNSIQILKKNKK